MEAADGVLHRLNFFGSVNARNSAIGYHYNAVGGFEHFVVVRRGDNRHAAFFVQAFEQFDDFLTGFLVEVSGRFVGQNNRRAVGQSARNRHALLLSARKLAGFVVHAVAESDGFEQFLALFPSAHRARARENHRQRDVFQRRHDGNQVESLENVADFAAAQPRQFKRIELRDVHFVDENRAFGGLVEAADHVEKRRFARTRRSHDGNIFAALDVEIDAAQRVNRMAADFIDALDTAHAHDIFLTAVFCFVWCAFGGAAGPLLVSVLLIVEILGCV